uniref:Uncharacterized protein n=1 Tax=Acrobeloides nanus TaxID=290746 RepID=A0A914EFA8_9BILA
MGEHSCLSTTELLLQAVNNVEKNQERELCEESIPVVGGRPSSSRILTNADIVRPGSKLNTRTINKRIRVVSTQTVLDKLRPTQSTSQNVFDPWNHLLTLDQDAPYRNIEFAHIHLFEKNQLKILLEMSKKNPFIFCGDDDYYMVYAGYLLKLKRSASYYVWKCVGGVAIGCNAVLRSVGDRLLTDSGHTHPPNFDGIETSVWNYYINDKVQVNISANSKISANFKISKTPVLVNHESRKKQAVAEKEIITLDEEQPTKSSKIDNEKLQSMILDAEDEIEMLIEGRAPKNPKANIEIKDVTSDFIGEASNSKQQENEENLPFLHESLANKIREFQETIIAEVKKAITAVEKNGFFYNLLENLERYAYKGYVYHLPEDDVWRCARRTKDSKLCSAKMKMIVRTTGAREVEILDEHDHQPDQVFILREVCRNILYRYISKNNIQQKYDEILTVLQGIAPDLLGGKILPRYGIAKRRVFDIKLSDEDVNRAQWLYEKNSQRSNTTGPPNKKQKLVVKNEEPDSDAEPAMDPIEETISEVMKKDPRRIKASIQIFPCLDESMYELEELDRPALNYDQIMEILSKPCSLFKNEFGCKNIGITLIEYATDPLFFTDGGEKKIAYRGDIYKLAHEDRDHIGSHAHNLSNIYKIFELQVIKLETDDRQVEPTSFKFLQLRAMAAKAEHIMASGIDPSILNFATVVQPKRVVPDEEMADAATPPTMSIQRQAVSRPHAIRPAFSLQVTSGQDFPRTIRMPIRLATPLAQIQAKGSMMEVPAEKDRWHVSIDYPIPFPLDESGLSRVGFCGFIYYKSHADFNILYFKCERAHPDNPLYKCRGALTISQGKAQGKAQQTNPHDHRANFQRMWMELKNAGIDIAIYGLPKMVQAPRPVPARIPNSPNIIQTNEVTMNSSDDETSEVKSTDRNRTRMTIQPTCSATLPPTKPLQNLVDVLKDEVSRAFKGLLLRLIQGG